jgi:uncharacterized protein YqeY
MSLEQDLTAQMKVAMKAKDQTALAALRAIKSEILLAKTSGKDALTEDDEIKLLQKLVKQRRESAEVFKQQGREDIAQPELEQAEIIQRFLPEQLSEDEVNIHIDQIIAELQATGMKDMGRVMGVANQRMAGRAEGRMISAVVKSKLA